jgi:membrane-bound lytic murein transglycosylase D
MATAAYNAGEGRIIGCLRQIDDPFQKRDFWTIRGCLALETQEYVPKIMAAAVIGADPKRFGFDLPTEDEMRQRYDVVVVPQITPLSRVAELAGVTVADLRSANNELDSSANYTPGRNYPMYVPVGTRDQIATALATTPDPIPLVATPAPVEMASREPAPERPRTYTVRRGDTLGKVADKYGVDVKTLASANDLRKPYTLNVGQRLEIPGGRGETVRGVVYTVRSGNSLNDVAELFGVTGTDIKSWNRLSSTKLKAGQKLTIHLANKVEKKTYEVRRGDTLARIAQRFAVSVEHLMTANGLKSTILKTGQQLVAYVRP